MTSFCKWMGLLWLALPVRADLMSIDTVSLQALDKVTGSILNIKTTVGKPVIFGNLTIVPRGAYTSAPEDSPETVVFLEIHEKNKEEEKKTIFSSWMFASSPAISPLEHPVYDVWVTSTNPTTMDAPHGETA